MNISSSILSPEFDKVINVDGVDYTVQANFVWVREEQEIGFSSVRCNMVDDVREICVHTANEEGEPLELVSDRDLVEVISGLAISLYVKTNEGRPYYGKKR